MTGEVRYRVADLVIDLGTGRVFRQEVELPLAKLSYELLLVMVQAAPNLLSLDDLATRVWKGVIVSPETVGQRVKLLRDALGDDAKAPRYIAGLRGRGYRLIAPVERLDAVPAGQEPAGPLSELIPSPPAELAEQPPQTVPPAEATPSHRLRRRFMIVAGLLAVIAALLIFALSSTRAPTSTTAQHPLPGVSPHSLAVLALSNLSGDPKEDYFVDGMSEEIANSLTRINQLRVKRSAAAPTLPGTAPLDSIGLGRKLHVATLLQGSVRKSGQHVRITVQLIDTRNGYQLWSHAYDRELKDALDLQAEIAERVADTLNVTLLGDTRHNLDVGGTTNPEAFEAYLKARHGESSQDRQGLRSGLDALDRAIELDPRYANAYAFRADLQLQLASEWASSPRERDQLLAEARADSLKSVQLAPASAHAHLELAMATSLSGMEFRKADDEFRKAAQLEPGNSLAQVRYAEWAAQFGREDALTAAYRATGRNPTSPSGMSNLGTTLFLLRRFSEARPWLRGAADQSRNPVIRDWAGLNELALGAPTEALRYCNDRTFNYDQLCMAIAFHALGRQKEAQTMLDAVGRAQGDAGAFQYAQIYASWGNSNRALEWLEKALALHDSALSAILCDPFLDSLRTEPRFLKIVAALELPIEATGNPQVSVKSL